MVSDMDSTNDELTEQIGLIKLISSIAPALRKLRELGDFVNIANLSQASELITTLVSKVLRKFDLALIRSQWKHNFLQQMDSFLKSLTSLYDLVLVIVSWKFERLMETSKDDQHHTAIDLEFDGIVDLVNQTMRLVYECSTSVEFVDLKTILIMKYIDFMLSFKVFYVKFEADNEFDNFQLFFNTNKQLLVIKRDMQLQILQLFLVKDKLASLIQVDLDRADEEDVNFDDYTENDRTITESSMFDDEDLRAARGSTNSDENLKLEKIWSFEKDLSVYTLKLLSLVNLLLVNEDVYSRVKMNKDKLGSVFAKILEQQESVLKEKDTRGDAQQSDITSEIPNELQVIADEETTSAVSPN